jgi:hypothetical protein
MGKGESHCFGLAIRRIEDLSISGAPLLNTHEGKTWEKVFHAHLDGAETAKKMSSPIFAQQRLQVSHLPLAPSFHRLLFGLDSD